MQVYNRQAKSENQSGQKVQNGSTAKMFVIFHLKLDQSNNKTTNYIGLISKYLIKKKKKQYHRGIWFDNLVGANSFRKNVKEINALF